MFDDFLIQANREIDEFFLQPNAFRSIVILAISLLFAYFLSRFVGWIIVRAAQAVAVRSDTATSDQRQIALRRVETYLSIAVAVVKALVVAVVGYFVWRILSPSAADYGSAAAIGASAFFIVLAGGTLGPLLRDITSGSTMIIERWFSVGDHIKVEPFWEVAGVVEKVTLRSTKIRSLNGEVVWFHNQHIHGVHVTPRGVRTMAIDVFVRNKLKGEKLIDRVINTIPLGATMLTKKLKVNEPETWGEDLWRIVIIGQVPPGREWLIEKYLVDSLVELDKATRGPKTMVHKPIARYADPAAEKNFKRAVRVSK